MSVSESFYFAICSLRLNTQREGRRFNGCPAAIGCEAGLTVELLGEEIGHVGVGFFGFGEADVVPEGVRERLEDDESGIVSAAKEGALKDGSAAEQEVAGAGDEERGGHAVEVGVEGREDGIFGVGGAGVLSGRVAGCRNGRGCR